MTKFCRIIFFISILLSSQNAHAYFDPGNGGYLFAALWGYLATFAAFIFSAVGVFFKKKIVIISGLLLISAAVVWMVLHNSAKDQNTKSGVPRKVTATYIHNPSLIEQGYNFVQGDLYDINGKRLHSWIKKDFGGYLGVIDRNGDLYAAAGFASGRWGRYQWNGDVIWEKTYPINHELLLDNDRVHVFVKENHNYRGRPVAFDAIITLDKNGQELSRWSTWDAFKDLRKHHGIVMLDIPWISIPHPWYYKYAYMNGGLYDYYHLNSMQIIPANARQDENEIFRPGHWLLSFREVDMIAILDKNTKKVLWSIAGNDIHGGLEGQHGPLMLPNGNILVFDNGRKRKWSRVIEIDPITRKIVWEYKRDGFYCEKMGYAQALPNGNVLITDTLQGHFFEVTRNKEVVWEHYRGHTPKGFKIRKSYRLIRYPLSSIEPLNK